MTRSERRPPREAPIDRSWSTLPTFGSNPAGSAVVRPRFADAELRRESTLVPDPVVSHYRRGRPATVLPPSSPSGRARSRVDASAIDHIPVGHGDEVPPPAALRAKPPNLKDAPIIRTAAPGGRAVGDRGRRGCSRAHRVRQLEERLLAGDGWQETGLVFATRQGRPIDAVNLDRSYRRLLKRTGLPQIRFHDLRHTCATLLLVQGVQPRVVGIELLEERLDLSDLAHVAFESARRGRGAARVR